MATVEEPARDASQMRVRSEPQHRNGADLFDPVHAAVTPIHSAAQFASSAGDDPASIERHDGSVKEVADYHASKSSAGSK
jgi:hypothetical protein